MKENQREKRTASLADHVVDCGHSTHALSGLWKWRSRFGERGMFACVVCWPPVVDADHFRDATKMVAQRESEVS